MEKEILVKNIRLIIKDSGMTQEEVCEKANINYSLFSQYLSVKSRRIPSDWIRSIAVVTDVSTDFIFGLSPSSKNSIAK